MIPEIGEDCILSKDILIHSREGGVIQAKSVGRLVDIINESRVVLFFEGRGRVETHKTSIRPISFPLGHRVSVIQGCQEIGVGVIDSIWTSASSVYMYRVKFDNGGDGAYESCRLRNLPETVGVPMVISELAKHMISVGSGCNPNTVPAWFTNVVRSLKELPQLSQMGQAQMEFVIKNHMANRVIDNTTDLVANVLFIIQAHPTHELRKMEERLYGYKEKLEAEWKRLDKIIPIEFQFAALKAYAETK